MSRFKPTPEQLAKLRDAAQWKADHGEDTGVIEHIIDVGVEQAATDDPPPTT